MNKKLQYFREAFTIRSFVKNIDAVMEQDTYYPDKCRKSKAQRLCDNVIWLLKNHEANRFYNSWGLDVKGFRKVEDFLPYRQFAIQRNNANMTLVDDWNQLCVLRDKVIFSAFTAQVADGKYCVPVVAIIKNGKAIVLNGNTKTLLDFLNDYIGKTLFVKKYNGECGDGVFSVHVESTDTVIVNHVRMNTTDFKEKLTEAEYIVQEKIVQHEMLDKINPSCINTVRIVTILDKNQEPQVFAKVLRIGVNGAVNDNASTGGFYVNIDDEGKLDAKGFSHKGFIYKHPDSGAEFAGQVIPMWTEVVKAVKYMHQFLPQIKSIGWDVAITPTEPVLVEGNDNWEVSLHQDVEGGLKNRWNQMMGL